MKSLSTQKFSDFKQQTPQQTHVVLFCGGRGSATITQELLRRTDIALTLIVNAYDDGLSTGELRGFIDEMLGPSDFRKNLSYLLDLHSEGQYALKNLLEFRFPAAITSQDIQHFIEFIKTEKFSCLIEPLQHLFGQLNAHLSIRIRQYLNSFFTYAQDSIQPFNYCDCSMGNLIFAGVYLEKNKNFNAAAKEMSQLVSSRAILVNVSKGENRTLVALKENGELLANEAEVVGIQSANPIHSIYLLPQSISATNLQMLTTKTLEEKAAWLKKQELLPEISPEAISALMEADIIIYGPGTQHSSLLPSYRIANHFIKKSPALVKAFVMNLEPDNDIQSLSASDVIDRTLNYNDDDNNSANVITHILLDSTPLDNKLRLGNLTEDLYKNAKVITHEFANGFKKKVHNGRALVEKTFSIWENSTCGHTNYFALTIFIDIFKRSLAIDALSEEFLEMDWKKYFSNVHLTLNQSTHDELKFSDSIVITKSHYAGLFPEVEYFFSWLTKEESEYLVLLTGDGEYRFRDVMLSIRLLEQSHFGAVFGSRTQSRLQFKAAIQAAYGEKKLLRTLSSLGAFLLSAIYSLRYGVIFSDPLTGFRIFRRSKIAHLAKKIKPTTAKTPITIAKYLIDNNVEIAELPVNYRTFSGFTDPYWRIRRGLKNLLSIFTL